MKLLFIYGPPAAGKLTVANEISKLTGLKVFDNHKTVECVRTLFPFEDPTLNIIRRKLQRKFRIEIFTEAAKAGLSFITTQAVAGPQHFDFYSETVKIFETYGGKVLFVQLSPSDEALMHRVEDNSRKNIKIETRERLRHVLDAEPELRDVFPDIQHLLLDNTNMSASETAHRIIDYYKLVVK